MVNKITDAAPITEASANKLYPVYITLFSNNTSFGQVIRKLTGSNYSHATISLDSSLNNMYSFSDIPFSKSTLHSDGFVRESLWSPMYRKNRFFTILVTFVDKKGRDEIEKKIKYMVEHYTEYTYNTIGLIEYYIRMKNTDNHDERKKKRWFCSEFVAGMLDAGGIKGYKNVLQSPQDIKSNAGDDVIELGDFTLNTFSEKDLKRLTKEAEIKYRQIHSVRESYESTVIGMPVLEFNFKQLIPILKKELEEETLNKYTALVDWKYLYDVWVKYFGKSNVDLRFDVFELIVRKYLIPMKKDVKDTTENIASEVKRIYDTIKSDIIQSADVVSGAIYSIVNGVITSFKYPFE